MAPPVLLDEFISTVEREKADMKAARIKEEAQVCLHCGGAARQGMAPHSPASRHRRHVARPGMGAVLLDA